MTISFPPKMSFIQFESGRDKDRVREELREARNTLLKQVIALHPKTVFAVGTFIYVVKTNVYHTGRGKVKDARRS